MAEEESEQPLLATRATARVESRALDVRSTTLIASHRRHEALYAR